MAAKKETRPKVPPKAMPKPRGSLQEATKRSKAAGAQLVSKQISAEPYMKMPAENEFADTRYANEPTLHRDIRLFMVSVTYFVILKNENPIQGVMAEGIANHSHTVEVAIIGDHVDPMYLREESEKYPTHDALSGTGSTHEVAVDEIADYYGNLVADRLVKDSDGQIKIKAVTVTEQHMPTLFINGIP